ncbi:hypothetical protein SAY86_022123 [Trapa natans]|uniref:Uncharacterized protein n=1 Tax=Trapa natans TaxID=22666 RepID=A0AAN7MWE0_TRANT|nr:hypothetical protein SAY86_022123 [Trapa natans]
MWELCIYYNKKTVSMRRSCEQNIPWQLAGGTLRDRRIRSFIRGGAVEGLGIICLVQSPGPCVWDPPLSLSVKMGCFGFPPSPSPFTHLLPTTHINHVMLEGQIMVACLCGVTSLLTPSIIKETTRA